MLAGRLQVDDLGPWCDRAERAVAAADLSASQTPGAKSIHRDFYYVRAALQNRQERYTDALRDLQRAFALDPSVQQSLANFYAITVGQARGQMVASMRSGQYDKAVAQTDALLEIPGIPGEALYDGACVFSVAAGAAKDPRVRERYATRSVRLLRRAFAAGFGKDEFQKMTGIHDDPVQHMERDADLAAVRDRSDYRALLAELTRKP